VATLGQDKALTLTNANDHNQKRQIKSKSPFTVDPNGVTTQTTCFALLGEGDSLSVVTAGYDCALK
jgi:hypothetical protein